MFDKTLLIVAHPGHELRIYHWLELSRPTVSILTDGSGGDKQSRIGYSAKTLQSSGSIAGPVFGPMSDKNWYAAILGGEAAVFQQAAEAIANAAAESSSVLVVSDAVDGYNPVHDLTYAVGQSVANRLRSKGVEAILQTSAAVPGIQGRVAKAMRLDDAASRRKLAAVEAYEPLAEEARRISETAPDALSQEVLFEADFDWPEDFRPSWEDFARKRVSEGLYQTPLTYRDHVRPLALAISGQSG